MKKILSGTMFIAVLGFLAISTRLTAQENWSRQSVDGKPDLRNIVFVNGNVGWICGDKGTVLRSSDGGENWKKQDTGVQVILRGIDFVDKKHGWATGGGYKMMRNGQPSRDSEDPTIIKTDDGGSTWKQIPYRPTHHITGGDFPLTGIEMFDQKKGWLFTGMGADHTDGDFYWTKDGGRSWNHPTSPRMARKPIYDLEFADPSNGFAVGWGSTIYHTSDGKNWKRQKSGAQLERCVFFGVSVHSPDIAWVAGLTGRVFQTTNAGENWKRQETGTKKLLSSIDFLDEKHGIAVGQDGTVLKTDSGGESWEKLDLKVSVDLLDVKYVGKNKIIAVGGKGTILTFSK